MEWTTDTPEQEGWYWGVPINDILRNACIGGVDMVYIFLARDIEQMMGLMINCEGEIVPSLEYSHFLGPLAIPAGPSRAGDHIEGLPGASS